MLKVEGSNLAYSAFFFFFLTLRPGRSRVYFTRNIYLYFKAFRLSPLGETRIKLEIPFIRVARAAGKHGPVLPNIFKEVF